MAKSIEAKTIEKVLLADCFSNNPNLAKRYGTTEVTIGFQRDKKGKEIVDFLSYNAKTDNFYCYEIKVSMQDFKSEAKKSWYGNYNYLVLTTTLFNSQSIEKWKKEIPQGIGIIAVDIEAKEKETILKATKQEISNKTKDMLKNSLLRTLFYQNNKR